jgi:hypothetical protein
MEILETPGISNRRRRALLSVVKMRELLEGEPGLATSSLSFKIDTKGTVIFTLPGGTIRDTGREVHGGAGNERVRALAARLAQARYPQLAKAGVNEDQVRHSAVENKASISR